MDLTPHLYWAFLLFLFAAVPWWALGRRLHKVGAELRAREQAFFSEQQAHRAAQQRIEKLELLVSELREAETRPWPKVSIPADKRHPRQDEFYHPLVRNGVHHLFSEEAVREAANRGIRERERGRID